MLSESASGDRAWKLRRRRRNHLVQAEHDFKPPFLSAASRDKDQLVRAPGVMGIAFLNNRASPVG
jgi:hypothetical protein